MPLRQAMSENTHLGVLVACGYYDLVTAWAGQKYTAEHLGLDPSIRRNLTLAYYPSGHQLYTYLPALKSLRADVAAFMKAAR
jgi:carboxypeptidase C (cathepsin A)